MVITVGAGVQVRAAAKVAAEAGVLQDKVRIAGVISRGRGAVIRDKDKVRIAVVIRGRVQELTKQINK